MAVSPPRTCLFCFREVTRLCEFEDDDSIIVERKTTIVSEIWLPGANKTNLTSIFEGGSGGEDPIRTWYATDEFFTYDLPDTLAVDNDDRRYAWLGAQWSYCEASNTSVGCKFTRFNESGRCGSKNVTRGLSEAERKAFLDIHNKYRSNHALKSVRGLPTAANMIALEWDTELAALAQLMADQCTYEQDKDLKFRRQRRTYKVGQNLALTEGDAPQEQYDIAGTVKSWYGELMDGKLKMNYTNVDLADFRGRFTQVIWAKSAWLGCGATRYETDTGPKKFKTLYVCNYGAAGNREHLPVYEPGKACSKCPAGFIGCKRAKGLCARI